MAYLGSLSTKEHYVLRILLQLATAYQRQELVSLRWMSQQEQISLKYLEHLMVPLVKFGWVHGKKGRNGGYILSKDPADITLRDILSALDEEHHDIVCLKTRGKITCALESHCPSKTAWQQVSQAIEQSLSQITLGSLL